MDVSTPKTRTKHDLERAIRPSECFEQLFQLFRQCSCVHKAVFVDQQTHVHTRSAEFYDTDDLARIMCVFFFECKS
jgi:hypothetical protein